MIQQPDRKGAFTDFHVDLVLNVLTKESLLFSSNLFGKIEKVFK